MTNIKAKELIGDTVHTIVFYDTIETLPIKRYQLLQKYSLIDGGIGSDIKDVIKHFSKMDQFIEVGDLEAISVERENILMNFNFILDEQSTITYILACMVKSYDGEQVDLSDDNIDELVDKLTCLDISHSELSKVVDAQKKSLINS